MNYIKRKLLVEGISEQKVIPYLMEKNGIAWELAPKVFVVEIQSLNGKEKLLNPKIISSALKDADLKALGLIVDADDNPQQSWELIRKACLPSIPDFPDVLSEDGLICVAPNNVKFGVWIMPDNRLQGMLETFLAYLIRDRDDVLWQYAQSAASEAKKLGAPYKEVHLAKVNMHTWLAWQKESGISLNEAVEKEVLDPRHKQGQKFVQWFRQLYEL